MMEHRLEEEYIEITAYNHWNRCDSLIVNRQVHHHPASVQVQAYRVVFVMDISPADESGEGGNPDTRSR